MSEKTYAGFTAERLRAIDRTKVVGSESAPEKACGDLLDHIAELETTAEQFRGIIDTEVGPLTDYLSARPDSGHAGQSTPLLAIEIIRRQDQSIATLGAALREAREMIARDFEGNSSATRAASTPHRRRIDAALGRPVDVPVVDAPRPDETLGHGAWPEAGRHELMKFQNVLFTFDQMREPASGGVRIVTYAHPGGTRLREQYVERDPVVVGLGSPLDALVSLLCEVSK